MQLAPVVLFTYNRPWHTKQVVEALRKNELSEDSDLIVFSDGSKNNADIDDVQAVRKYLKTINGFKSIYIIESSTNKGLANSIITGVTEIIHKYGQIIVLEDDLLTTPDFLFYMNQSLKIYKEEEKVMQISGHMFNVEINNETNAIFLPFTTSWGWATWKRAWKQFDTTMSGYNQLKKDHKLQHKFNLEGAYNYFSMAEDQIKEKIDSWAIRWYLSVFLTEGLTLYPINSLVQNIGFDGSGTHFNKKNTLNISDCLDHQNITSNINFSEIKINEKIFHKIKLHLSSKQSFISKLKKIFTNLQQLQKK